MSAVKTAFAPPPQVVPGTNVRFGQEKSPRDCLARARWERHQVEILKQSPQGAILAEAHQQTAEGYEWLAKKRESEMLSIPQYLPGTKTRFGAESTVEDLRIRAQWERDRAALLTDHIDGPTQLLAPNHLNNARSYEAAASQLEMAALTGPASDFDYECPTP